MPEREASFQLEPVSFKDLPYWGEDKDLALAFSAYDKSESSYAQRQSVFDPKDIQNHCETHFTPMRVVWEQPRGLVTGYFEPVLEGSRQKSADFPIPIYKKPSDLVSLINDHQRAKYNDQLSYMRQTPAGHLPYPTRQQIESGVLDGENLELLFLRDQVDAYFLHVQGSGKIEFPDGSFERVTYAAKNGHPYSSIGRILIERNHIPAQEMSLQSIQSWLRENKAEAREIMWQNKSYIFFRALSARQANEGPRGAADLPLTPERSLAVDASVHALGSLIWVSAPALTLKNPEGFHRLMVAQDVGSAIKGPERGDIYWGSGEKAGALAGRTNHEANFFVLLPKTT